MEFQEMSRMAKGEQKRTTKLIRLREIVKYLEQNRLNNKAESKSKLFGLPDEMWEKVLSHVRDLRDLRSIWGVHPKFRDISSKSQTNECLLSEVLSIGNLPYLWKDDRKRIALLRMFRTFSKALHVSADRIMDECFTANLHAPEMDIHNSFVVSPIHMNRLDGILANFCYGPIEMRAKRVFHRTLCLVAHWNDLRRRPELKLDLKKFKFSMTTLLQMIGDQIWYFRLYLDDRGSLLLQSGLSMSETFVLLYQLTFLMPNLKALAMDFMLPDTLKNTISPETLENHLFPHLPRLERVRLGIFPSVELKHAVAISVIRPNNLHIKFLDLKGFLWNDMDPFLLLKMMPLLSIMKLSGLSSKGDIWGSQTAKILQPVLNTTWKLKHLSHSFIRESQSSELGAFFKFVNNIPTLEILSIRQGYISLGEEISTLALPNLTYFELRFILIPSQDYSNNAKNVTFFTTLKFLFPSRKLKSLTFCWTLPHLSHANQNFIRNFQKFLLQHEQDELIKFNCGFQITQSNLWDFFPQMERVKAAVPHSHGSVNREMSKRHILKIK